VPGAFDGGVRLPGGAGHAIDEHGLDAPEYRVTVAERAQERPVVAAQHVPGGGVRVMRGIVGRDRHQRGEHPGTGFVAVIGERRVVGGDDVGGQLADRAAADDPSDVENR
jgi:hypothetical protein